MLSNQTESIIEAVSQLRYFLGTAHLNWTSNQQLKRFQLPNGETISCVFWNNTFFITGTDIVRSLVFRFSAYGRPVKNMKKFEEGIFSDLRNLKPGVDAILEEPRSEFLEMLYKNNCIRTQKKQKVFYWFSVPHDRLFMDALERDHKRESEGKEPSTVTLLQNQQPLVEAMTMNPQTKIPSTLKHYSQQSMTPTTVMNQNSSYYIQTNRPHVQPINTSVNYSSNKTINMNYPMVHNQIINNNSQVVQIVAPSLDSGNNIAQQTIYSANQQPQSVYYTNSTNQQQTMFNTATTNSSTSTSTTATNNQQPMYTNTTNQQPMYTPTSANPQQPMYSPTSANPQQPMYSPTSANPQQQMYSPTSANPQQQMYSPTTNSQQTYSPTSANPQQPQTIYSPTPQQQQMYTSNVNNWVNQQQQSQQPIYTTTATNVNTSPIYSSNYVITSSQQMMPSTTMNNGNQSTQMVSPIQPQYINQMPSQITVQQLNSSNNNYTLNSQEGLDQSEMKNNGNQNFSNAAVTTSSTAPGLIQTTIVYAPTSVATIYSPTSSTSTSPVVERNNGEQIVFTNNETSDTRDECNYTCDVKGCGRRFKRMEFLRRHQRCHSNDSSYGKEMLNHRKSNSDEGIINTNTMVNTPTYQSISNIQTTPQNTNTSSSLENNNIITHMPSPPTTDIPYSNVYMKSECNPMYTPVSPSFNNVSQDSNGMYYNQQFNNINGYNQGTNTQNKPLTSSPINTVNSTTTSSSTTLYPTQSSTDTNQSSTDYHNIGLFHSINENSSCSTLVQNDNMCQMPSPPLQYQTNYQNQPIYASNSTQIY